MNCPCCGRSMDDMPIRMKLDAITLPPQGRRVLNTLADRFGVWVSTPELINRMRFVNEADHLDRHSYDARRHLFVIVARMRKRVAEFGVAIEAERGSGANCVRMVWA